MNGAGPQPAAPPEQTGVLARMPLLARISWALAMVSDLAADLSTARAAPPGVPGGTTSRLIQRCFEPVTTTVFASSVGEPTKVTGQPSTANSRSVVFQSSMWYAT